MLCGYSLSLLKSVLDNSNLDNLLEPNPYEAMLKCIKSDKYDVIRDVFREISEYKEI